LTFRGWVPASCVLRCFLHSSGMSWENHIASLAL
jgi:hypothetical protein